MYSTIYKIPITFPSIPYTYEPKLHFLNFVLCYWSPWLDFSLQVVPSLSLVLILIYGNSEQKFLFFKNIFPQFKINYNT